jgi:hypothetical protein
MKHDRIEARQARHEIEMNVGGYDVSQSMIPHDSCVDAIARPHALRSVLLEESHGGLHIGRGDGKNLGHERHQVSCHVDGVGMSAERPVTVENLLNDFGIDGNLNSTSGDLRHYPLTSISVAMGRTGGIHRNGRVQQRTSRRGAHLLDGSSNDLLFHLVPIRHGQLQREKPLQCRLAFMERWSHGGPGMALDQGADYDLNPLAFLKRERLRRPEDAVFIGGFGGQSHAFNPQ